MARTRGHLNRLPDGTQPIQFILEPLGCEEGLTGQQVRLNAKRRLEEEAPRRKYWRRLFGRDDKEKG